jgi:hypothetical protein
MWQLGIGLKHWLALVASQPCRNFAASSTVASKHVLSSRHACVLFSPHMSLLHFLATLKTDRTPRYLPPRTGVTINGTANCISSAKIKMRHLIQFDILVAIAWILSYSVSTALAADGTVTIELYPSFTSLRDCARSIVSHNNWLKWDGLRCPTPYYDNCYCREDLGPTATSYIRNVALTYCKYNSVDYTAVLNLYNSYCADHGLHPDRQPTAQNTGAAGEVTATIRSGATETIIITSVTEVVVGGKTSRSSQFRRPPPLSLLAPLVAATFSLTTLLGRC